VMEAEVVHGSGDGTNVVGIARADQNDDDAVQFFGG
jgi:hypothetical protein